MVRRTAPMSHFLSPETPLSSPDDTSTMFRRHCLPQTACQDANLKQVVWSCTPSLMNVHRYTWNVLYRKISGRILCSMAILYFLAGSYRGHCHALWTRSMGRKSGAKVPIDLRLVRLSTSRQVAWATRCGKASRSSAVQNQEQEPNTTADIIEFWPLN